MGKHLVLGNTALMEQEGVSVDALKIRWRALCAVKAPA